MLICFNYLNYLYKCCLFIFAEQVNPCIVNCFFFFVFVFFYVSNQFDVQSNRALCQNMRSARKRDKAEKKEEKEKKEKEKVALSLKLTRLESKKQAKARLEAAEKAARIAHRTRCKAVLNAKLEKLVSFQSVLFIYSCSFVLII